jgi:hypothetical protein
MSKIISPCVVVDLRATSSAAASFTSISLVHRYRTIDLMSQSESMVEMRVRECI